MIKNNPLKIYDGDHENKKISWQIVMTEPTPQITNVKLLSKLNIWKVEVYGVPSRIKNIHL